MENDISQLEVARISIKKIFLIIVGVILIIIVGYFMVMRPRFASSYADNLPVPAENEMPQSVNDAYLALEKKYGDSLGAGIKFCRFKGLAMYSVWGSGGFSGESKIFNAEGQEMKTSYWSDTDGPTQSPDPYKDFKCFDIKSSKNERS